MRGSVGRHGLDRVHPPAQPPTPPMRFSYKPLGPSAMRRLRDTARQNPLRLGSDPMDRDEVTVVSNLHMTAGMRRRIFELAQAEGRTRAVMCRMLLALGLAAYEHLATMSPEQAAQLTARQVQQAHDTKPEEV